MKKLFKILFLMSLLNTQFLFVNAQQNLVPNPSFEDTINCVSASGSIETAYPWFTANSTPDYYSQIGCGFSIPEPSIGYQMPRTGNAYAGIFCYDNPCAMECLEVRLDSTLEINKCYCVEFYLSLANESFYAVNKIGVHFSNDTIKDINACFLPYAPHIEYNNIILDTTNWIKISGSIIATGNENFLTIGIFHPNDSLLVDSTNAGSFQTAYYFVDDVSVKRCNATGLFENEKTESNFNVYPNPISNSFVVNNKKNTGFKLSIYNLFGEELIHRDVWQNQTEVNTEKIPDGTYILKILSKDTTTHSQLITIQH